MLTPGERVAAARVAKSLSQNDLQAYVGSSVSKIENDKLGLTAEVAAKIAPVLGVAPEWLLYGKDPQPPFNADQMLDSAKKTTKPGKRKKQTRSTHVTASTEREDIVLDERYPNREVAIALYEGIAQASVIKSVRSISFKNHEDPPVSKWCVIIEDLMRKRKRIEAGEPIKESEEDWSNLDLHI